MSLDAAERITLTTALRAAAVADNGALKTSYNNRDDVGLAAWFNSAASPSFTVWKNSVPLGTVGKTFVATAIAAITAGNNDKLTSFALWNPDGVNPSRQDQRDFFEDIFSVAAGATTRAALQVLWRKLATNYEKIFANTAGGNGADATPAAFGVLADGSKAEGSIPISEVSAALNVPGNWTVIV